MGKKMTAIALACKEILHEPDLENFSASSSCLIVMQRYTMNYQGCRSADYFERLQDLDALSSLDYYFTSMLGVGYASPDTTD